MLSAVCSAVLIARTYSTSSYQVLNGDAHHLEGGENIPHSLYKQTVRIASHTEWHVSKEGMPASQSAAVQPSILNCFENISGSIRVSRRKHS